jgi:plasmid stabilization system protein ParE
VPRSHPLQVSLSLEAELDLIDIFIFTEQTFGFQQKEIYADWIDAAIARISLNPEFGRKITKPPYLRYHVSWAKSRGSHYLYYRVIDDEALAIARVLYDKQDYTRVYPFNES